MDNLAKNLISELSEAEKIAVKNWAQDAYIIRNDETLSKKERFLKLYQVTNREKILKTFFKSLFKFIKKHGWDERSLAGRFMLGGAFMGAVATTGKAAGIASSGFAFGVPVWILTSSGAAFLGTILEEFKRTKKEEDKK